MSESSWLQLSVRHYYERLLTLFRRRAFYKQLQKICNLTNREKFWYGYEQGLLDPRRCVDLSLITFNEHILHGWSMGLIERQGWLQ